MIDGGKQLGGQRLQALTQGLLRHEQRGRPQQAFALEEAHRFLDRADLSPDKREDEGHHDRQGEGAFAQAERVIGMHLGQRRWMDQVGEVSFQGGIGRGDHRALPPVALDRPGMAHGALNPCGFFRRGCHSSILPNGTRATPLTRPQYP